MKLFLTSRDGSVHAHRVTIRTAEASYDSFVCGAHELVLADEGRLAGSTPIGGAK